MSLTIKASETILIQMVGDIEKADSIHLRQKIPVEIWKLVANNKHLQANSDDLISLSNSSPFFRNLIASQRTLFLFEKVFSLVGPKNWEICGHEGLPRNDILNCRSVCSQWNNVIDKVSKWRRRMNIFTPDPDYPIENVFNFLTHFDGTHSNKLKDRNPFIWRDLRVSIYNQGNEDEEYIDFVQGMSRLTQKYGSHIYDFSFFNAIKFLAADAAKLEDWLVHMPNLKTLNIDIDFNSEHWVEYEAQVRTNPFPKFEYLKSLILTGVSVPIFKHLVQLNNHITFLRLEKCPSQYNLFTITFSNLKSLDLSIVSSSSNEMFENLSCRQVEWPLQSLRLFFETYSCFPGFKIIFQIIQSKFANALQCINLNVPTANYLADPAEIWRESTKFRLQLPHLKEIDLAIGNPISLDFLLPMKNTLETMKFNLKYEWMKSNKKGIQSQGRTIVQFFGFEDNIWKSNIFNLFTRVEKIGITFLVTNHHHVCDQNYYRKDRMKCSN